MNKWINYVDKVEEMSYDVYFDYLKNKYGEVNGNYFIDDNCTIENKAIRRWTKEHLNIHHYYEFEERRLCKVKECNEIIKKRGIEVMKKYQAKENLCYCDIIEHARLHVKIIDKYTNEELENLYPRVLCDNFFNGYAYNKKSYIEAKNKAIFRYDEYLSIYREYLRKIFKKLGLNALRHFLKEPFKDERPPLLFLFNRKQEYLEYDFISLRMGDLTKIYFEELYYAWENTFRYKQEFKPWLIDYQTYFSNAFDINKNIDWIIDSLKTMKDNPIYDKTGYVSSEKIRYFYNFFVKIKNKISFLKVDKIVYNIIEYAMYNYLHLYTRYFNCNRIIENPIYAYLLIKQTLLGMIIDNKNKVCEKCNVNNSFFDICKICYLSKNRCSKCKCIKCIC